MFTVCSVNMRLALQRCVLGMGNGWQGAPVSKEGSGVWGTALSASWSHRLGDWRPASAGCGRALGCTRAPGCRTWGGLTSAIRTSAPRPGGCAGDLQPSSCPTPQPPRPSGRWGWLLRRGTGGQGRRWASPRSPRELRQPSGEPGKRLRVSSAPSSLRATLAGVPEPLPGPHGNRRVLPRVPLARALHFSDPTYPGTLESAAAG